MDIQVKYLNENRLRNFHHIHQIFHQYSVFGGAQTLQILITLLILVSTVLIPRLN